MKIDGKPYRTIWPGTDGVSVHVIDQTRLPFAFETRTLRSSVRYRSSMVAMCVCLQVFK